MYIILGSSTAFRESQNGRAKGISKSLFFSCLFRWTRSCLPDTNVSPRLNDLFHFCLLSFCLTAPGKWKTQTNGLCVSYTRLKYRESFLRVPRAPLFVVAILLVHLGTEIIHGHSVENGFNFGNQGLSTFLSDSWALISYQTWFYLEIYALNTLRISNQIYHFMHTELSYTSLPLAYISKMAVILFATKILITRLPIYTSSEG